MKKLIFVLLPMFLVAVATTSQAQEIKKPKESKTLRFLSDGELDMAKAHIDGYFADPKNEKKLTKGGPWVTKGKVYQAIATTDNEEYKELSDKPVEVAMDAYEKVKELEKENSMDYLTVWGPTITGEAPLVDQLYAEMFNKAVAAYEAQDLRSSVGYFEKALEVFPADTNAMMNVINSGWQLDDTDLVAEYAKKLIGVEEYQGSYPYLAISQIELGKARDYQLDINQYKSEIRSAYIEAENAEDSMKVQEDLADTQEKLDAAEAEARKYYEAALEYINPGLEKFPENQDLLTLQTNTYLQLGEDEKAIASIESTLEKNPENSQLLYNLGVLYDRLDNIEKSAESYRKAIEIDPEYYDAVYNLSVLYYMYGNKKINAGNEFVDMRGNYTDDKGKELHKEGKDYFEKALPYLEKAHEMEPDERQVLEVLYRLYTVLENEEKIEAVAKKLENMPVE